MNSSTVNLFTVLSALITFAALATGAVLFIDGNEAMQKVGLLFAFFATIVPSVVGALHAAKAREQTNGSLDTRIEAALYRAQNVRRREVEQEQDEADRPTSPVEPYRGDKP